MGITQSEWGVQILFTNTCVFHSTSRSGMGDLRFLPEFSFFFFFIFTVENIAFSSANSHLVISSPGFFSFLVPIPVVL